LAKPSAHDQGGAAAEVGLEDDQLVQRYGDVELMPLLFSALGDDEELFLPMQPYVPRPPYLSQQPRLPQLQPHLPQ
jgi:hypothetical protein